MKKFLSVASILFLLILAACSNDENNTDGETDTEEKEEKETIVLGNTSWTSTEVPNEIVKQILEEAGFEVEIKQLDQPIIFEGLREKDIDFFMDAWLPYTEEELWSEYEDDLIKVSKSYSEAPLGWAVPKYVEEDSIEDINKNPEKFDGTIYTIDAGAGVATIGEEVIKDYDLTDFEMSYSSEGAMISELDSKISNEEPIIITGWRPHSMFIQYDLKILDEPKENYKADNVYVISYNEIKEEHPEAYEILSNWSIGIDDLEEQMYEYEINEVPFEESAKKWIEEHRDEVDNMLDFK